MKRNETALVTGACSGIGLAMARELASRGFTLVLVSNRPDALSAAAATIAADFGAAVRAIPMDLARPDAAIALHAAVAERGLAVDALVNNAGMFFFGEVADIAPERAAAMLGLHVVTPSLLCALFGRDMRARRRGRILIVSSISAFRDFPGIAHYGATKRYLRSFASSLRSELGVWGVSVTCLAPGATATSLLGLPADAPLRLLQRTGLVMDPADVARRGIDAMLRGDDLVVPGPINRAMTFLAERTPQRAIDAIRRFGPWLPRP